MNKSIAYSAALLVMFAAPAFANAMTVSPPTLDREVNPGDTFLETVQLYNENTTVETLYPLIENFTAGDDERGQPKILKDADPQNENTALKPWVTISSVGIVVKPGERRSIPFSINVPKNATPGGHYGAILFSSQPQDGASRGVTISSQIGVLMLVNVSGEVREVGHIATFGLAKPQAWYSSLPVDFMMRFENNGNTHLRPVGSLLIYDWMGKQVAAIPVNGEKYSVLPMSARKFDFGWHKAGLKDGGSAIANEWNNFGFGTYTAKLVLNYGKTSHQVVMENREFTVWPWHLLIAAAVAICLALLLLTGIMMLNNRMVIKRYERSRSK
jgi:hypothetical protein